MSSVKILRLAALAQDGKLGTAVHLSFIVVCFPMIIARSRKAARELPHILQLIDDRFRDYDSICFPRNSATVEARRWSSSVGISPPSSMSIITQPRMSPWQRMGAATPR